MENVLKVYFRQIGNKIQLVDFHDSETERRVLESVRFDMSHVYRDIKHNPEGLKPTSRTEEGRDG